MYYVIKCVQTGKYLKTFKVELDRTRKTPIEGADVHRTWTKDVNKAKTFAGFTSATVTTVRALLKYIYRKQHHTFRIIARGVQLK